MSQTVGDALAANAKKLREKQTQTLIHESGGYSSPATPVDDAAPAPPPGHMDLPDLVPDHGDIKAATANPAFGDTAHGAPPPPPRDEHLVASGGDGPVKPGSAHAVFDDK